MKRLTTSLFRSPNPSGHPSTPSIAFGQTETSPVTFQTTLADPILKRITTVGRVAPHVSAKLIHSHKGGTPVGIGEVGELCVAGYVVQRGYWGDEVESERMLRRGDEERGEDGKRLVWFETGDEGIMDEEGYLRIVGRKKDVIIRGLVPSLLLPPFLVANSWWI